MPYSEKQLQWSGSSKRCAVFGVWGFRGLGVWGFRVFGVLGFGVWGLGVFFLLPGLSVCLRSLFSQRFYVLVIRFGGVYWSFVAVVCELYVGSSIRGFIAIEQGFRVWGP